MKTKVLTLMLLGAALTAAARDYPYLTIEQTDGSKTSLTANGLTISYSGGYLVAKNGTESANILLGNLSAMRFTTTNESSTAGVTGLETVDGSDINISDADAIYDLSGRKIEADQVKRGVYILKKGNQTRKIQVK